MVRESDEEVVEAEKKVEWEKKVERAKKTDWEKKAGRTTGKIQEKK